MSINLTPYKSVQSNLFVKIYQDPAEVILKDAYDASYVNSPISFDPSSKFGTHCAALDSNAISVPYRPEMSWGTNPFTFEGWFKLLSTSGNRVFFDQRKIPGTTPTVSLYAFNGQLRYYSQGSIKITASTNLTAGQWYHIALCRSGTSTKLFINGVQTGSTYTDTTSYFANSSPLWIGRSPYVTSTEFSGYVDEVRISKSARYTSNFTVQTAPHDCDSDTLMLYHFDNNLFDDNTALESRSWLFSDRLYPTVIDGDTYLGIGKLMGITETASEIRASSGQLTITVSGIPNSSLTEVLNSKIKGCPVYVYRMLFDPVTQESLNIVGNPLMKYRGFINNFSLQEDYTIDSRSSTNTIVLTCSSAVDV